MASQAAEVLENSELGGAPAARDSDGRSVIADKFDSIIVELGRRQIHSIEDVLRLVREITERSCTALDVAHASFWVFNEDHTELACKSTYDRSTGRHSRGVVLEMSRLKAYYDALNNQRAIAVDDTSGDAITAEFFEFRLAPLGVRALLDVPLWADGRLFGVVSFLHCGEPRKWSREERQFASSVADVIAVALHASGRRRYERELSFRLEFEHLILTITNHLINLDSAHVESGITSALARIGEFSGVDRVYLFFFAEDRTVTYQRYEWCAEGIAPFKRGFDNIRIDGNSRFIQKLVNGAVVHVPQVSQLADNLYSEKQEWLKEGIRSLVCVPLISAGNTVGFMGFDSLRAEKSWTRDFISLLKIAGSLLLRVEERKRAEEKERMLTEQVQHSQKLESLGILAGGIAHDFNNLLMGVLGNSELLLKTLPESEWQREYASRIHFAAKRAADLTHQLLAYSGKAQFDVSTVNLSTVVEEMKPLLKTAVAKNIALTFELGSEAVPVKVDVTQIRQVLLNLITNASEAIGEGNGSIAIHTGVIDVDRYYLKNTYVDDDLQAGRYAFLDVQDSGHGIARDTLERIFDPFFTTKFTGRGLGLAVVMGIVRSHGGAIKVFTAPNEGTTFRVLLAEHDGMQTVPAPDREKSAAEPELGEGLVLVVDDEEITRVATQDMLEVSGFEAMTANGGREALELFKENRSRIKAVLLDMTMPNMSGTDVFSAMQRVDSTIPIVFTSGYSEVDALEKVRGLPIAGFIQKPYGMAALCEVVNRAMSGAG